MSERRLPPVTEVAVVSLALIIAGGIVMASQLPHRPSLGVPVVLLCLSAGLFATAASAAVRIPDFAHDVMRRVAGWTGLAYAVVAGMIEFTFIRNHTSGSPLIVLTLMLVVFALDVCLLISFGVARFQAPDGAVHQAT